MKRLWWAGDGTRCVSNLRVTVDEYYTFDCNGVRLDATYGDLREPLNPLVTQSAFRALANELVTLERQTA